MPTDQRRADGTRFCQTVTASAGVGPDCVAPVRETGETLGVFHRDMLSQAGHDAYRMAARFPSAMAFSPCGEGIARNETGNTTLEAQLPAVNTSLDAVVALGAAVEEGLRPCSRNTFSSKPIGWKRIWATRTCACSTPPSP